MSNIWPDTRLWTIGAMADSVGRVGLLFWANPVFYKIFYRTLYLRWNVWRYL